MKKGLVVPEKHRVEVKGNESLVISQPISINHHVPVQNKRFMKVEELPYLWISI